jgi:hypothetical protein
MNTPEVPVHGQRVGALAEALTLSTDAASCPWLSGIVEAQRFKAREGGDKPLPYVRPRAYTVREVKVLSGPAPRVRNRT